MEPKEWDTLCEKTYLSDDNSIYYNDIIYEDKIFEVLFNVIKFSKNGDIRIHHWSFRKKYYCGFENIKSKLKKDYNFFIKFDASLKKQCMKHYQLIKK